MRIRSMYLLFLALLAAGPVSAGQEAAAKEEKKAAAAAVANSTATPPSENWASLSDLRTGLQSPAFAVVQHDEQADFVRELVRVQWRLNDPIDLWVSRPKSAGKVPVVLYLYSYNDVNDRFHDNGWCQRATADGFAAVGFVSALTDYRFKMRPLKQWFVSELPEALGSSVHDVQLILNYLANRGDMDMDHVGMFGMGSGATIAILAAQADPRVKALDLLDPWGAWPQWLRSSPLIPPDERTKYVTPEFLKSVAALDPVTYLPSLRTPILRLQQTSSEPVTPVIAKETIAAAMPIRAAFVKYSSPQDLLKAWQVTGLSGWIKQQMRPEKPNQAAKAN